MKYYKQFYNRPFNVCSQTPSEMASPFLNHPKGVAAQLLPTNEKFKMPDNIQKHPLQHMESVVEQNAESSTAKSSTTTTPSCERKLNPNKQVDIALSAPACTAQDLLTEKLLASSTSNNDRQIYNGKSDCSSEEVDQDTENTNDLQNSTENICNGNCKKTVNAEVV